MLYKLLLFFCALFQTSFAFSPSSSKSIYSHHMSKLESRKDVIEEENNGLRLGFIGCGTIASAIINGFLTQKDFSISSVIISRRSESKSHALNQKYGDEIIQISDDNQHIVDNSEIIFLCVLPEQEEEVLSNLTMNEEKTLVSLVVSLLLCFVLSLFALNVLCLHIFSSKRT